MARVERVAGRMPMVIIRAGPFQGRWFGYRMRGRPTNEVACRRCRATTTDAGSAQWFYRPGTPQQPESARLCPSCLAAARQPNPGASPEPLAPARGRPATEPGVAVGTTATSAEEGQMARADPGRSVVGPDPLIDHVQAVMQHVVWDGSAAVLADLVAQVQARYPAPVKVIEARVRDYLARMRLAAEGRRPP